MLKIFTPSLRTLVADQYADLAPLNKAVKAKNWPGVVAYFDGLPARSDKAVAVSLLATTAGTERMLQKAVDTDRDSALARTLLGARFIAIG